MAERGRQERIGKYMNFLRYALVSILVLTAPGMSRAQPPASKPVLSADPATAPPATATAAPPQPAGPLMLGPNYVIGASDSIQVTVFGDPATSATLPVRPDGKITLPLVGDIVAAGFTPMQLAANITESLKKFRVDPTVNVTVLAVNSKRIFLIDEVNRPGPMDITPGMTILQALSGGLTPYAKRNKIYILRGDPGKQQKIPFDYNKALKKGDMQGVVLLPGDTIVVP